MDKLFVELMSKSVQQLRELAALHGIKYDYSKGKIENSLHMAESLLKDKKNYFKTF